jgi:hypothetical protein
MLLAVCCNDLEDSNPLKYVTVSLGKWFLTFQKAVEALYSRSNNLLELLCSDSIWNYCAVTATRSRRLES